MYVYLCTENIYKYESITESWTIMKKNQLSEFSLSFLGTPQNNCAW